jgi:hypothetical protein
MDNFMKNKELLRNRDLSSDMRTIAVDSGNNNNTYEKLIEMKRRLEFLRSQKP